MNPVHIFSPCLFKVRFNYISLSTCLFEFNFFFPRILRTIFCMHFVFPQQGHEMLLFSTAFGPALRPTQPSYRINTGALFPGLNQVRREADYSSLPSAEWRYISTPHTSSLDLINEAVLNLLHHLNTDSVPSTNIIISIMNGYNGNHKGGESLFSSYHKSTA
jgi:hypothetical protein